MENQGGPVTDYEELEFQRQVARDAAAARADQRRRDREGHFVLGLLFWTAVLAVAAIVAVVVVQLT